LGDKIEKNELGRAFTTCGGKEKRRQVFFLVDLRKREHLRDPGVEGIIILRWIFRK
jgi:hypothetical protein